MIMLLLKGGSGSGNHGHLGRLGQVGGSAPSLPDSSGIKTSGDAKSYWERSIKGRRLSLHVRSSPGKSFAVEVTFPPNATHMWSREAKAGDPVDVYDDPARKRGERTFDPARAIFMDQLFSTISRPWKILGSRGDDLYIGSRLPGDRLYTVVLRVISKGQCEFVSAYPRPASAVKDLVQGLRSQFPAGLKVADTMKKSSPAHGVPMGRGEGMLDAGGLLGQAWSQTTDGSRCLTAEGRHPVAALDHVAQFMKMFKALGAGERWITVKAPGHEKGQPILIRDMPDGSAKVIGGAGGSMNHLRLTGVRSQSDYKEEALSRASARRDAKKRERERDKKDGLLESKTKAREALRAQVGQHQATFVQTVAKALGWKDDEMRFPEETVQNASPAAQKAAAEKHAAALFQRAQDAVKQQRQRLVQDAEMRSEAGLGEVPLTTERPEDISVQDLAPIAATGTGLGFAPAYGKRAEASGLSKTDLEREAAAARPAKPPSADGEASPEEKRRAAAARVAEELKGIRESAPKVDTLATVDPKVAVELLRAEKALKAVRREAKDKRKLIDGAKEPVEPKAYVLETGQASDADIERDLEQDLRTLRTRAFLDEVGKTPGGDDSLGRHIGVGAYNSINAVALAAGGSSLLDRSVVDVMGIAGSAQVLARRLASDLTPEELGHLQEAMATFHVDHYMRLSEESLREARSYQEMAAEIEVGEAATGAELAVAQEMNAKRREFIGAAQRTLGTAVGEMEANAALSVALKRPRADKVDVSLGSASIESAIRQARAIGLDRGDYQVAKIGASTILTVHGHGMDKLAAPVARSDLERTRAALDVIEGRHDEADWLPAGVARRPDLAMDVKPGTAPRLARPYAGGDPETAIKAYIGGRAADGDPAADIMAGLLSEDTIRRAGDRSAYMAALEKIAPLYGADGKQVRAETYQGAFEVMADDYVAGMRGEGFAPIHKQQFPVDQVAVDALHRALAATPEGVAAFKPVGELSPQDQRALRDTFAREYGRVDPASDQMREELRALDAAEPEREVEDMFGRGANPEHGEWRSKRDGLAEKLNAATMTWGKYLDVMGSPANAYAAMQDVVRSKVLHGFAEQHNRARPDKPLKIGTAVIQHDLNHLDALDPAARERRLAEHRGLVDRLRTRVGGKYAAGSVADKLEGARAAEEAVQQSQMGLFGDTGGDSNDAAPPRAPELGERYTIGHQAERQVAAMMPHVGANFRPGQPVKLWEPTMSGRFVGRQRAIKLIRLNKRMALGLGVGSGKTSIGLAGYTDAHARGDAKRGLFVVPSIVQGQFHGEALTMLEPGKYNWHCNPSADRKERIAAYKNPDIHFNVVTHQAFRDDMLHLAGQREGTTPDAVAEKLDGMTWAGRRDYMRDLMQSEGIDHDYMAVDEGHSLLNRAGKENSRMANVLDGVAHGMGTYVNMTADPIKNDPSEAFDLLAKMDPERYSDRDAFLRKYGVDTPAAKDGLRRELVRHLYTGKIESGVKSERREVRVDLDQSQHATLKTLSEAAAAARLARMKGKADVTALQTLSPGSFKAVDPAQHEAAAENLNRSIGILHDAAVHHAINGGAKTESVVKAAAERRGRPGVVFAHHLDRVQEIADRLKADGHRVVTLTGGDSSAEKDRKKREYQAGQHDVMVTSDAAAVGANLQHGKWLMQYDTPETAMLHAQRNGRIDRMGQTGEVELLDLVANHPAERRARQRLTDKYALRDIVTSPLEGLDDRGVAGYLNRVRAGQVEAAHPVHAASSQGGLL